MYDMNYTVEEDVVKKDKVSSSIEYGLDREY